MDVQFTLRCTSVDPLTFSRNDNGKSIEVDAVLIDPARFHVDRLYYLDAIIHPLTGHMTIRFREAGA